MLAILTALPWEAKPLIELFKMKAHPSVSLFPIYQNNNTYLIVSGLGKIHAALAVGYLQAQFLKSQAAWLNVGIAGHRSMALGEAIIAHKVIDMGTSRSFYPTFLSRPPQKTHVLRTVEKMETAFPEDDVYEMEASGFMQAALKFSTSELIHCFKIISDNQQESINIEAQAVEKLIKNQLNDIYLFADNLQQLNAQTQEHDPSIEEFTSQWPFTVTEKHQLMRLIRRWTCLTSETAPKKEFAHLSKAQDVLHLLEKKINSLTMSF